MALFFTKAPLLLIQKRRNFFSILEPFLDIDLNTIENKIHFVTKA